MIRLAVLLIVLFIMTVPALAQQQFFQTLPDIPLMAGLEEMEAQASLFDSPQGRIAEGKARLGLVNAAAVMAFYQTTLPQLGWRKTLENQYFREGEVLELAVAQAAGGQGLVLSLLVRPTEPGQ